MQADPTAADSTLAPLDVSDYVGSLAAKLHEWLRAVVLHLPNLLLAVLIVVAAAFLARIAKSVVRRGLTRATEHSPHARNVVDLLATLAYVAVMAAGTFVALGVLNLDGVVTSLLAGAGILGLALGFAFQDIASNFIAGVLMAVRAPFLVGQMIETNGFTGTVAQISLRSTVLTTFQGQRVILPNAKVYGDAITNFSARRERRVDLPVGVGYGDDLDEAERLAVAAVEALPMCRPDRPVQLYYTAFGESSVEFTLRFWIDFAQQTDFFAAQSAAIKAVKGAFDAHGITIPFPIRTLDFGPSGGVALREAFPEAPPST
jgi:small conductance mechanosensitive channel